MTEPHHLVRPEAPTSSPELAAWAQRGCRIGARTTACGAPIWGAYAVTVSPSAHDLDETVAGVLLVCRPHFDALDLVPLPTPQEAPCSPPSADSPPSPPP